MNRRAHSQLLRVCVAHQWQYHACWASYSGHTGGARMCVVVVETSGGVFLYALRDAEAKGSDQLSQGKKKQNICYSFKMQLVTHIFCYGASWHKSTSSVKLLPCGRIPQDDPEPVWVVLCWKWHCIKIASCWPNKTEPVRPTEHKLGQSGSLLWKMYGVTHCCGCTSLLTGASPPPASHTRNAKNPSVLIKKKYQELVSYISHSQPVCFVLLSSTWHFKIRVITPAGALAAHKQMRPNQCTREGRCYIFSLWTIFNLWHFYYQRNSRLLCGI